MTKKEKQKILTQVVKDLRKMLEGDSSLTIMLHGVKRSNIPSTYGIVHEPVDNIFKREYVSSYGAGVVDVNAFIRFEDRANG